MVANFISEIIAEQKVYVLEYKGEVAISQSLLFKNDNNFPVDVICFWSKKTLASACCKEDWKVYKPQEVCLATFIEDYLVQIYNNSFIVGIDFDFEMQGVEADPLDVLNLLINRMKAENIYLEFEYFKDLQDLEEQLKKIL